MNSVIALEELVKQNGERVKFLEQQLAAHDSGENKLSRLSKASAETSLETTMEKYTQHKAMLDELLLQDQSELEEKQRIEAAIKRKKYFDDQNMRIKKNKNISADEKLEAMIILDELPEELDFEDESIIDIATKSLELNITNHEELFEKLTNIRKNYEDLIKSDDDEQLKELSTLSIQIPVVVLQFHVLVTNINESIETINKTRRAAKKRNETQNNKNADPLDYKEIKFSGLPKYEDWWLNELWLNHQAYFGLYKWKSIINNLCLSDVQKRAWSKIYSNWIFIKKMLNNKGLVAFDMNFAFDSLLTIYAGLEEELDDENLASMERIVKNITVKEDFTKYSEEHNRNTPYFKYKIGKSNDS